MRIGCSAVPQGAGIIQIRKLRKISAFQSVPYHTVPAQELNTKASEKQLAGCIVFQRFFLARRTMRKLKAEKAKGKQIGRPQITARDLPATFLRHYPAYQKGRLNVSELARVCDLSRTTVYKYIGLLEP